MDVEGLKLLAVLLEEGEQFLFCPEGLKLLSGALAVLLEGFELILFCVEVEGLESLPVLLEEGKKLLFCVEAKHSYLLPVLFECTNFGKGAAKTAPSSDTLL